MNRLSKSCAFMFLYLVVIFGLSVSICFSKNSIEGLRKAAEQGDAVAQFKLGWAYDNGEGVPKDPTEAVRWYRKAAEQGNAGAQFNLGFAYEHGQGVPKDLTEAIKWFLKSAEQGNAVAQYEIGVFYTNGQGVPKDLTEAIKWFLKSAEQGDAFAQHNLGYAFFRGKGISKNAVEAMKWYRRAAYQGFVSSQYALGFLYAKGEGAPKDEIEALSWFNIAAASGDQNAINSRARLENRLSRQANLIAQQRSKEILEEIEFIKQSKGRDNESIPQQDMPSLKASGTGVFVTNDGLILTAAHVVGKSSSIKVVTQQGSTTARIVKLDAVNDLALLKCEGRYKAAPFKPSGGVKLGQLVFTIGFPNIGFQGFSPKMTRGEISSLSGFQDDPRTWQISVPVQPGNSGGPLFDEAGNLVGVVLSKLDAIKVAKATGDLTQNVNYAIKSTYALPLLEGYTLSEPLPAQPSRKLETVVEKVQSAVVLILIY